MPVYKTILAAYIGTPQDLESGSEILDLSTRITRDPSLEPGAEATALGLRWTTEEGTINPTVRAINETSFGVYSL